MGVLSIYFREILAILLMSLGFSAIIGLIVLYVVWACCFARYAAQKGHSSGAFFWACFLFGIVGYIMVAALPDITLHKRLERISAALPANSTTWTCENCNTENSTNYGQCKKCGKLTHLDCDFLSGFEKHIMEHHGFSLEYSGSILYGICKDCRN